MNAFDWLANLSIAECILCLAVLALAFYRHQAREFRAFVVLLGVRAVSMSIMIPLLFFRQATGLSLLTAYHIYFFTYWSSAVVEGVLLVVVIYSVYNKAMRPLKGLQRIGRIIFRWVAVVSVAVSLAIVVGPHLIAGNTKDMIWATMISQIQQGTSVLTLCLLLFVCFAIRPLGLTFRSRIFGVTLGLGVTATTYLIQAAWLATSGARLYSLASSVSTIGSFISVCVWGVYFALPEPERKMILLPTTSPFFTWNRISEALGDEPGFVAIAGFKPEMLAAAELKVLSSSTTPRADRLPAPSHANSEHTARPTLQQIAVSQ